MKYSYSKRDDGLVTLGYGAQWCSRHIGQCYVMVFVVRRQHCSPCSSSAGTCAPRGTTVSVTRRGSNTRPWGRRSHAGSWLADRAQPSPGRGQVPRRLDRPRGSSRRSFQRPARQSVRRKDVREQMSGSPTTWQRTTTHHSSLKSYPVDCTYSSRNQYTFLWKH